MTFFDLNMLKFFFVVTIVFGQIPYLRQLDYSPSYTCTKFLIMLNSWRVVSHYMMALSNTIECVNKRNLVMIHEEDAIEIYGHIKQICRTGFNFLFCLSPVNPICQSFETFIACRIGYTLFIYCSQSFAESYYFLIFVFFFFRS